MDKDGWRAIETAPRDGTRILVWTETDPDDWYVREILDGEGVFLAQIAVWGQVYGGSENWIVDRIGAPKFWMPLPPPPQGPRP